MPFKQNFLVKEELLLRYFEADLTLKRLVSKISHTRDYKQLNGKTNNGCFANARCLYTPQS